MEESSRVISVSGVHDKAGGLVHHQHVTVFIHDIEGNVFGKDFVFIRRPVHDDGDDIEGLDPVVRFYRFTVDQNATGLGGLLYAVAGDIARAGHEELVDAQQLLSLVGDKLVMLIHLPGIPVVELYIFIVSDLVFHFGTS